MSAQQSLTPPAGQSSSGSIRKRTRRACEPCRRRKRKCDGAKPCRPCQEYEYPCFYADEQPVEQSSTTPVAPQQVTATSGGEEATVQQELRADKFYEPTKRRFYDADSAISFPRALASSLQIGVPPRIHSFAYNVGVATERFLHAPEQRLSDLMTLQEAQIYAARYFETVNKLFAVVNLQSFNQELPQVWLTEPTVSLQFENLACFVILLGSLFLWPQRCDAYQELVEYSQHLLDQSSFHDAPSLLHYEHLQAWILRTVFVRCTTRPNITWMSSSITMHMAESLGLHREYDTLEKLDLNVPMLSEEQLNARRRLFWIAWTLNRMISFEIGRSATFISSINAVMPQADAATSTSAIIEAYQSIYPKGGHVTHEKPDVCLLSLSKVTELKNYQDLLIALVRADIACGLYRVIHKSDPHIRQSAGEHLVSVVKLGLEAVRRLTEQSQPWWLLTSMPFQFICVAVAVGKSYVLEVVPQAMEVLENVNRHFGSKMTQEAYDTASLMLQIAVQTRDRELFAIKKALVGQDRPEDQTLQGLQDEDWGLYFNNQLLQ